MDRPRAERFARPILAPAGAEAYPSPERSFRAYPYHRKQGSAEAAGPPSNRDLACWVAGPSDNSGLALVIDSPTVTRSFIARPVSPLREAPRLRAEDILGDLAGHHDIAASLAHSMTIHRPDCRGNDLSQTPGCLS